MINTSYILRYAAGSYWIIKTNQLGAYEKPVATNECGALLWKGLMQGADEERLAELMQEEYKIEFAEATENIRSFLSQLKEAGIKICLMEKGSTA